MVGRMIPWVAILAFGLVGCGTQTGVGPASTLSATSSEATEASGWFGRKLDPKDYPVFPSIAVATEFTKKESNLGKRFALRGRFKLERGNTLPGKVLHSIYLTDHTNAEPHYLWRVWGTKFDPVKMAAHGEVTVFFTVGDGKNHVDPITLAKAFQTGDGKIHWFSKL